MNITSETMIGKLLTTIIVRCREGVSIMAFKLYV